jgi:hypothetical protein
LLWRGRRTALPRHETLNAMLDWSYSLLSEREKVVLCRLSVFVGDFTRQAADSVASETEADEAGVIDAVASLVAKFLISTTVINESTYYRLLDATRAYAATKLAERDEANRIARRHATYYAKLLEHDEIIQSLFGEHDLSGYAPHIGNVRAALGWALSGRGDVAVGIELATWAAPLFTGLSLLEECRGWCERALAAFDDASRGTRQEMILQEALALSSMFTSGHSDQVGADLERGLALAKAFQDRGRQLRLLAGLNLSFCGSATSAAPWRPRNRLASSRRLPGTRSAPSGRSGEWAILSTLWAAKPSQSCILSAVWHSRLSSVLSMPTSSVLIRASSRSSALPAPCGCVDSPIRHLESCKAASRGHPVSVCVSLVYVSTLLLWTGDLLKASDLIEHLIVYAGRYSLAPYRVLGIARKGELAIARDEPEAGLDLLRSALETLHAQRTISRSRALSARWQKACARPADSRRRCSRSTEPLRAQKIVEWNLTCPNCFGSNRRFSRRNMTANQR